MNKEQPAAGQLIKERVAALPLYNAGLPESLVREKYGITAISRLASNENPLGMSPKASAAAQQALAEGWKYSDPTSAALRRALAEASGIGAERIVAGNGSEELIALLCRACLRPGDRVVTISPSFLLHDIYAMEQGAKVISVAMTKEQQIDLDGLIREVRKGCRMLIFSNPSNPVGCFLSSSQLGELLAQITPETLLVLDEAYYEYASQLPAYPQSLSLLAGTKLSWVVLRTFSKAYGLAGLRVGYGLFASSWLAEQINRLRQPFNVNAIAQAAAIAALDDRRFLAETIALNTVSMAQIEQGLATLGLKSIRSAANFIFMDSGRDAAQVAEALLRRGIIVKPWKTPGYENYLRVTVGSLEQIGQFLKEMAVISQSPRTG